MKLQQFMQDDKYRHPRVIGYLVVSGILGWLLATRIADNEVLTVIFAPAINYALYVINTEIEGNQ